MDYGFLVEFSGSHVSDDVLVVIVSAFMDVNISSVVVYNAWFCIGLFFDDFDWLDIGGLLDNLLDDLFLDIGFCDWLGVVCRNAVNIWVMMLLYVPWS